MTGPVAFAALGLLFLITFVSSVSSRRARLTVVPWLIGASAGLFSVQFANVHLFTPIVIAWALARAGHREAAFNWRVALLPIAAVPIALTVFLGDLVVNPNLALQLMALAVSAALLIFGSSRDTRRPLLLGLLWSMSASAFFGLLQVAHVVPTNLWHVEVSALGRPTGFYPEPDWLGMYSAVATLLAWRIELRPSVRLVLVLVNLSALVLAFARAAWLGFAIAALFAAVVWLTRRDPHERIMGNGRTGRLRAVILTAFCLVLAVTALPDLRRDLGIRLASTLTAQSTDVSAQARVEQNRVLGELATSAPWFGHGLSASGRVGVSGIFYTDSSTNSVASNWLLGLWVDSAWLALPLLLLIAVLIWVARRSIETSLLVAVLVSSLFSNAFFQPITWLLLAVSLGSVAPKAPLRRGALSDVSASPSHSLPEPTSTREKPAA